MACACKTAVIFFRYTRIPSLYHKERVINRTLTGTNGKNIDLCSQLCSGKGIPHTVNGLDLLFQPQFAAQMLDMYIHRAGNADAGVTPGGMQQVAAAYSLTAVVKQHLQQGKLCLLYTSDAADGVRRISSPWRVTARACQSIFKSL